MPNEESQAVESPLPFRRYATVAAFEAALKTQLAAQRNEHRTIQDLRKQLAFDRVLARLIRVAPDAWLLKGGVALEYRLRRARTTVDIDISAQVGLDPMIEILAAAASVQLDDYFTLRLGEGSRPTDDVETYRFGVAVLFENGRMFEELKIDVGFADPLLAEPEALRAPAMLDFVGIPPITVRAIPIEQHLAEKIHAYTRRYANRPSTRVKDLVDMALLVASSRIRHDVFVLALREVFRGRGTHIVPEVLPSPPANWRAVYARLVNTLPVPQTSDEAHRFVASALEPALKAAAGASLDRGTADGKRLRRTRTT
jgi:predicted nucleotidyltransferase component of viral defense system